MEQSIARLREIDTEIRLLEHISALLGWDQETYMPEQAIAERSQQLALVQSMRHRRVTDEEVGRLLETAGVSDDQPKGDPALSPEDGAFLRALYREYARNAKLPNELVMRIAEKTSTGQAVWAKAREADDFGRFAPHLVEIIELTLEVAELIGYDDHPYDALLDEYEPWMKSADVKRIFDDLRGDLVPLVQQIGEAEQVDDSFLMRSYPAGEQEAFGRRILSDLGYDMRRGRLDVSAHPFTTTLGFDDVRLTTRYNERYFKTALFGTIHECGHGFYELGFDEGNRGSILASATSLGIHESQSRFWENVVGRSRPFWERHFEPLRETFPSQLRGVTLDDFYRAVNKVEPSHIRVEADEVTYSLHIILRFELELGLTSRKLSVQDIPEAWRERSRELLGIVPERDSDGPLQDIHWSMGGIGYFPTYSLGNLYAAQFTDALRADMPDLDDRIRRGDFPAILTWLRDAIHRHGAASTAGEIAASVTGHELDPSHFMEYLRTKYSDVYGLS